MADPRKYRNKSLPGIKACIDNMKKGKKNIKQNKTKQLWHSK